MQNTNETNDGHKFIIDTSGLIKGDILLSCENTTPSVIIRKFTESDYSHAMLYVSESSIIHSDSLGVHALNPQRKFYDNETDVRVLRVKDGAFVDNACEYSRTQIGKQYDYIGAIATKNPLRKSQAGHKQFCSRLVAQAYQDAGLRLVGDSDFCTPQELDDSEHTFTVGYALRPTTEADLRFAKTDDPIKQQSLITNSILSGARKLTGNNKIQSMNDVCRFMVSNPEFDEQLCALFENSGYLDSWKNERERNEWRYDGEKFMQLQQQLSLVQIGMLARDEIVRAEEMHKRYSKSRDEYLDMMHKTKLKYAKLHYELCNNLVEQTNANISAAKFVLESFGIPTTPADLALLKKI